MFKKLVLIVTVIATLGSLVTPLKAECLSCKRGKTASLRQVKQAGSR